MESFDLNYEDTDTRTKGNNRKYAIIQRDKMKLICAIIGMFILILMVIIFIFLGKVSVIRKENDELQKQYIKLSGELSTCKKNEVNIDNLKKKYEACLSKLSVTHSMFGSDC